MSLFFACIIFKISDLVTINECVKEESRNETVDHFRSYPAFAFQNKSLDYMRGFFFLFFFSFFFLNVDLIQ